MEHINDILKVINNPVRMEILRWLDAPEKHFDLTDQLVDVHEYGVCVSIIQKKAGLSQSTISSYLSMLQREKLLVSTREGSWTYYKRNNAQIEAFLEDLRKTMKSF